MIIEDSNQDMYFGHRSEYVLSSSKIFSTIVGDRSWENGTKLSSYTSDIGIVGMTGNGPLKSYDYYFDSQESMTKFAMKYDL